MMKQYNHYLTRILTLLLVTGSVWLASCGDDESPVPSILQFENEAVTVSEDDAEGVDVVINFDRVVQIPGTVEVHVGGTAEAGEDYTISPNATNNVITLDVATGDENAVITITPIDNEIYEGSKSVTLTLMNAEGVQLGSMMETTVTITEDDAEPVTIAEVIALHEGADVSIDEDTFIEGVVVSERTNITGRNIVVQDETGGIVVRFNDDNANFDLGDAVRININGGTVGAFNGLLQISDVDLTAVTETGTGTIQPEEVTLEELLTGEYQSRLVTITDVSLEDADGEATFEGFETYTITDINGNEVGTFVRGGSPFEGQLIPVGVGSVTGVPSEFSGTIELIMRNMEDLNLTESADITVTGTVTDFGSVDNGTSSASQSVTLSGTNLMGDVTIEASENFEVSLNDTDFSSEVTVPAATAEGEVPVYIRFSPTTGVNIPVEGTVSFESFGAVEEEIEVSGTESGNATVDRELRINEFHYDNAGTDENEFVEIRISGVDLNTSDLSNYSVVLYNGNNGTSYGTYLLSDMTRTENSGNFYYDIDIPGIQNGAPDGIALVGPAGVIEFLSYEGVFTATDGPASEVESTDVGVEETGTAPVGSSLQRMADDTWEYTEGTNTRGAANPNE